MSKQGEVPQAAEARASARPPIVVRMTLPGAHPPTPSQQQQPPVADPARAINGRGWTTYSPEHPVQCGYCCLYYRNLQGHSCPERRAALHPQLPPVPNQAIPVKHWPFQLLADVKYEDIFCSPLTIGSVPPNDVSQFSAIVSEITRHILNGEKLAWKALFLLPRMVFALPRGGKAGHKLAHTYLALFSAGEWGALLKRRAHLMGDPDGLVNKQRRAIALARAGYFSGAARALTNGKLADPAVESVYQKLVELHPAAPRLEVEPSQHPPCIITDDVFARTVSDTLPRRAPDATGWRGDYFKVLSSGARDDIFKLVERVLKDPKFLPEDLRPFLFGARLMAVLKPDGGIRPIAVGAVLRKLVSQALSNIIAPQLPDFFCPLQHGVGVPGGAENVVQGLRILKAVYDKHVIVGVDFSNAFNSVDRAAIAAQVEEYFPQVSTWFDLSYGKPSHLLVRNRTPISSQRGVQQGDPLGPFFFALALQPALMKAAQTKCYVLAYLDDVYLCGTTTRVQAAMQILLEEASKIGLNCNKSKSWATDKIVVEGEVLPINSEPKVLGVPLDVSETLPLDLIPKELMEEISSLPDIQTALHLLRYVHNSRLTYHLRLSSRGASQDLAERMMFETYKTLSVLLKFQDIPVASWQQALLPQGPGLGLTDLVRMAPYMAFASVLETATRLCLMDPTQFMKFTNPGRSRTSMMRTPVYKLYQEAEDTLANIEGANAQFAKLQHFFAVRVVAPKMLEDFFASSSVPKTAKAIVKNTYNSPIAKELFHAIPTQRGLALSSPEMRIALCLLLGINLEMDADPSGKCDKCKGNKMLTMYHALSCKHFGGLITRHDKIKAVLGGICRHARLSYDLEPPHFFDKGQQRPDLLIRFGNNGRDVAYDLTIINPVRTEETTDSTIENEQKVLAMSERSKNVKYQELCAKMGAYFCPIVLSAFGGILQNSFSVGIESTIKKINKSRFVPPNWAASNRTAYWLQRIVIALWAGNVAKVKPFLKKEPLQQLN